MLTDAQMERVESIYRDISAEIRDAMYFYTVEEVEDCPEIGAAVREKLREQFRFWLD